jgi:hypothetical protein
LNLIRVMPAKGETAMASSRWIAGLIGPLLAALGVTMLVNRDLLPEMAAQVAREPGLILLSGILLLLAGLAIVRVHNVWSGGWRVLVTVLGWLAIVSGLVRMWFPWLAAPIVDALGIGAAPVGAAPLVAGLVLLALGGFLSYKAYGPET